MAEIWLPDEDVWRCADHPTLPRRTGVCPLCLRLRLLRLCPHCASDLPCCCCNSSASSSSAASCASPASSTLDGPPISHLLRSEPAFSRSHSSRPPPSARTWSARFPFSSSRRSSTKSATPLDDKTRPPSAASGFSSVFRSMSVRVDNKAVPPRHSCSSEARGKSRTWHIPSPMKLFSHRAAAKRDAACRV